MYFSGKITNSFFTFLNRYDLDTSLFFQMTPLEIDFIREPESWLDAKEVEKLIKNIRGAYQPYFIDKDLVATVGHNAPNLKSWGALDGSLQWFKGEELCYFYRKIDRFLNLFISPPLSIQNKIEATNFFSFYSNFPVEKYPYVKDYLLAILESLPIFLGYEQTEGEWNKKQVKIYYTHEQTLPLLLEEKKIFPVTTGGTISHFKAREVLDSRGCPALEVELVLKCGLRERAIVPSGASKGRFEARELRDGDANYFFSKGLKKACQNIEYLSSFFEGWNVQNLSQIDSKLLELDSSPFKEKLGANSLLGISLVSLRMAAKAAKKSLYEYATLSSSSDFGLPVPLMNVINGGCHGSNALNIQEFMIVPLDFSSFRQALRAGSEVFYCLKQALKKKGYSIAVGDEGGFSPSLSSSEEAFDFLLSAIEKAGYEGRVALALDCAASEFFKKEYYEFEGQKRSSEEMIKIYEKWQQQYPLISIEDPLHEEDWSAWSRITKCLGHKIQLVGDDLFVTQKDRVEKGIQEKAGNALLVKYNQVGTITEAKAAILKARFAGWACILSHRSGETEDTSIADLSVAWRMDQIKTGSLSRGERTAKYNQLLRIEEELGKSAFFNGRKAFKNEIL